MLYYDISTLYFDMQEVLKNRSHSFVAAISFIALNDSNFHHLQLLLQLLLQQLFQKLIYHTRVSFSFHGLHGLANQKADCLFFPIPIVLH